MHTHAHLGGGVAYRSRTLFMALVTVSAFLLCLNVFFFTEHPHGPDACRMPRYGNPDSMHTALVPGWFLHLLSLVLLLFLLATCCHDNDSLHRALTTMVWYHCTYSVLAYLRMYLLDFMCSVKTPNGVSGHIHLYTFGLLATLHLFSLVRPQEVDRADSLIPYRQRVFAVLYGGFMVIALVMMSRTYYWGYHTGRQCLYGVLLGLVSFWSLVWIHRVPWLQQKVFVPSFFFLSTILCGLFEKDFPYSVILYGAILCMDVFLQERRCAGVHATTSDCCKHGSHHDAAPAVGEEVTEEESCKGTHQL